MRYGLRKLGGLLLVRPSHIEQDVGEAEEKDCKEETLMTYML